MSKAAAYRSRHREKINAAALVAYYKKRSNNPHWLLWNAARTRHKKNWPGQDFITINDINFTDHCTCCGWVMRYGGSGRREHNSATLDRKNNAMGYIRGNVFVICWRCNNLKASATKKNMIDLLAYMEA